MCSIGDVIEMCLFSCGGVSTLAPLSSHQDRQTHDMPAWSTDSDGLKLDLLVRGTGVLQTSPTADANESKDPTQTDLLQASAPTETGPYEHDVPDCTHVVSSGGSRELPLFLPSLIITGLTRGFMAAALVVFAVAHFFQRMRKRKRRRMLALPSLEKGVRSVDLLYLVVIDYWSDRWPSSTLKRWRSSIRIAPSSQ